MTRPRRSITASLTLSFYITVFPALTLSPTAFFHPSSIITLSFLSCLSKQIAGRLLLPLWPHFETLIWIPSPSAHPLHHHSCVLPPLTQSFLTCLYVYDPMQLGEQPLWVVVFFFFLRLPFYISSGRPSSGLWHDGALCLCICVCVKARAHSSRRRALLKSECCGISTVIWFEFPLKSDPSSEVIKECLQ